MASLRVRLLVGTLFWVILSLIVAGLGLGKLFHQHVAQQLENELRTHLDQLTASLDYDEELALKHELTDPRFTRPLSGLYWQINGEERSLRSRSLWDQKLDLPPAQKHLQNLNTALNVPLLVLVRDIRVDENTLRLAVAIEASALLEPVAQFKTELWLALAILGAGLVFAAVVQVLLGLTPLKHLREDLQQVRAGQSPTLHGHYPSEIAPLVSEFNAVLKHNQQSVARARTQAGNLAHALKTPLSVLANAASAEQSELAKLVAKQTENARAQVDYHLHRARAAALRKLGSKTPLKPVIEGITRVLAKLYAEKNLSFEIQADANLAFAGEEPELQEMLGNLLDNASKWANSRIQISAEKNANLLKITIEDDGQGLTNEQKSQVLQRGVRADERTPGTGLGLNIVNDLAEEYGGKLELQNSNLGGLKVLLWLPAVLHDA